MARFPFIKLPRGPGIPFVALLFLITPPLFWFYLSWKATGNWLACFEQRQHYHVWLLTMNPALAHFSFGSVMHDGATLLFSTDIAVITACCIALWFVIRSDVRIFIRREPSEAIDSICPPLPFFFSFLSLLVIA